MDYNPTDWENFDFQFVLQLAIKRQVLHFLEHLTNNLQPDVLASARGQVR